jgi:creatinine amidohydrolase/Fe(II)-dependent formamide hydrolase-like protein
LVVPIGSVEQHGPHLPVFTDSCIAEGIAHGAAGELGEAGPDVWILPTITYGRSGEHLGYPGTFSVSTETLLAVCRDLGRSAAASGFRRLVFVNAHGGNSDLLGVVARDIRAETDLLVFPISLVRFAVPDGLEPDASFSMHGGFAETSVMLALDESMVNMERAAVGGRSAQRLFDQPEAAIYQGILPATWLTRDLSVNGVIGDPRGASLDTGKQIVDAWCRELARLYRAIGEFGFTPEA